MLKNDFERDFIDINRLYSLLLSNMLILKSLYTLDLDMKSCPENFCHKLLLHVMTDANIFFSVGSVKFTFVLQKWKDHFLQMIFL